MLRLKIFMLLFLLISLLNAKSEIILPWNVITFEEDIALFCGKKEMIKSDKVIIKVPEVGSPDRIPFTVTSDIKAKRVIILKKDTPSFLISLFNVPIGGMIEYSLRLRFIYSRGLPIIFIVIIEGLDGKVYYNTQEFQPISGGCEG